MLVKDFSTKNDRLSNVPLTHYSFDGKVGASQPRGSKTGQASWYGEYYHAPPPAL